MITGEDVTCNIDRSGTTGMIASAQQQHQQLCIRQGAFPVLEQTLPRPLIFRPILNPAVRRCVHMISGSNCIRAMRQTPSLAAC